MKIEINGVEREGQIVSVPRGGFCIGEEGILSFPLFAYICNAIEKEDMESGILVCPIYEFSEIQNDVVIDENMIEPGSIRDCVYPIDIEYLIKGSIKSHGCKEGEENAILYWLDYFVDEFEIHGTPISRRAKEYIERVRKEKKLDF